MLQPSLHHAQTASAPSDRQPFHRAHTFMGTTGHQIKPWHPLAAGGWRIGKGLRKALALRRMFISERYYPLCIKFKRRCTLV